MVTKVIAARDGDKKSYFVNDGIYTTFQNVFFNDIDPLPELLDEGERVQKICDIWGPTCCGLDLIKRNYTFSELEEGDLLLWPNMGAYTISCATNFSGFEKPTVYYF